MTDEMPDGPECPLANVGLVILDFDGVVADSEILSLSTLRRALASYGIDQTPDEVRKNFLGKSLETIRSYVAENGPSGTSKGFAAAWQDTLFAAFRADLKPVPSIPALVTRLQDNGLPYCVASSSTFERLGVALDAMDLADHFPHVFSAEQVARGKPAPDLFLYAADQMGVAPSSCLVIEDSPFGIRAAVAAGMTPLGFVGGQHLTGIAGTHAAILRDNGAEFVVNSHERLFEMGLAHKQPRNGT